MSALEPFVKHKNDTGIPAIAVSISDIKEFFKGAVDPEIIKRGIEYTYVRLFSNPTRSFLNSLPVEG